MKATRNSARTPRPPIAIPAMGPAPNPPFEAAGGSVFAAAAVVSVPLGTVVASPTLAV